MSIKMRPRSFYNEEAELTGACNCEECSDIQLNTEEQLNMEDDILGLNPYQKIPRLTEEDILSMFPEEERELYRQSQEEEASARENRRRTTDEEEYVEDRYSDDDRYYDEQDDRPVELQTFTEKVDDVIDCILNPLFVYEDILNMTVSESMQEYTYKILDIYYELFNEIFIPVEREYSDELIDILNSYNIDITKIAKEENPVRKLGMFSKCLIDIQPALDCLKYKIIQSKQDNEIVMSIKEQYGEAFKMGSANWEPIMNELQGEYGYLDKSIFRDFAVVLTHALNHGVEYLMNPDDEDILGEIESKGKEYEEFLEKDSIDIYQENSGKKKKTKKKSKEKLNMDEQLNIEEFHDNDTFLTFTDKEYDLVKDVVRESKASRKARKKKNHELEIDSLVRETNALDKSFGCKLKKPKGEIDTKEKYYWLVKRYKLQVLQLLGNINQVNINNYIETNKKFTLTLSKFKISKRFKQESKWFDGVQYDVEDIRFKARYITYISKYVLENIDDIATVSYQINGDSMFALYETKSQYMANVIEKLCDMICKIMKNEDAHREIMYFVQMSIYLTANRKNHKKVIKKVESIEDQLFLLSDRLRFRLNPFRRMRQDISMDTLLKLAYLCTIHDLSAKKVVPFIEGYKYRKHKDTRFLIQELGHNIIFNSSVYGGNKIFLYFMKSGPQLYCRWSDVNEDVELLVGLQAINFLAYISGDKRIKKMVRKVTCR